MSILLAFALLQASVIAADKDAPDAAMREAYSCLTSGTEELLKTFDWKPERKERWRWATTVVDQCKAEIEAAARSEFVREKYQGAFAGDDAKGISDRDMLRIEAIYYTDSLIKDHFGEAE